MMDRRRFLGAGAACAFMLAERRADGARSELPDDKHFQVILNNDINNILVQSSGARMTPEEYRRAVRALIVPRPGILAQDVGIPDPVIYPSEVATPFGKYITEVSVATWPKEGAEAAEVQSAALAALAKQGTDALTLTIEECHHAGVFVVASYRMNAEDWYQNTWKLSDFGRGHPNSRIPGTGALDPADPLVFEHRAAIFRELAAKYDVDGIEFDYMRWTHMVSSPHANYPVLTREVRETRRMLDETARRKGRKRLILGARVGYSLDGPQAGKSDFSCKDLGLDVRTWIEEGSVDYLCPSYFWPRLPGAPRTAEFAALARNAKTGIYPTLFPLAAWQDNPKETYIGLDDISGMMRLKRDLCAAALQMYQDGADGISTFNWVHHSQPEYVHRPFREDWGPGSKKVQMEIHGILGSPDKLRACLKQSSQISGQR